MSQTFGIAVKALIKNAEGKLLILFKSDTEDMNPHDFDIPGGRVQWGEQLENAIIREVKEETGLTIQIERVSRGWGFTKGDLHLVGISFLTKCEAYENIVLSDEHSDFFWKSKEEILNGDFPNWLKEEILAI